MSALSLERTELWPGGAPGAKGANEWDKPWMSIHRPEAGKANGAAMLVCPGGGYNCVVINHEGLHVAKWLNDSGVTAFVLTYRVKPNGYTPDPAFTDEAVWHRSGPDRHDGLLGRRPSHHARRHSF